MKTISMVVAAAVAGFGGITPAMAGGDSFDAETAALRTSAESAGPTAVKRMGTDSLHPGALSRVSGQSLVSDPDYWVFDVVDDGNDAYMYPELRGAGLAVAKGEEENLDLVGLADSDTYGGDEFGFLMDVNADGASDYGALVNTYMELGQVVRVPLFKFVAGNAADTGQSVLIGRLDDGYLARIQNWRGAGMTRVSYTVFLDDGVDTDFAPNRYGSPIPVGEMVPADGDGPVPSDDPVRSDEPIQSADPVRKSKPQTSVAAKPVRKSSKLRIDVNPNRRDIDWKFKVQKKKRGRWVTLAKRYRTRGAKDVAVVDLRRGTYRAMVMRQQGHQGSTSWAVKLKR